MVDRAIILSAGRSSRLGQITQKTPKCLLDVGGLSIIDQQLVRLLENGIHEVTIVVGFEADQIKRHLTSTKLEDRVRNKKDINASDLTLNIKFIHNIVWDATNNGFSLKLALVEDQRPFLLLNGDVVCHGDLIKEVLNSAYQNALGCQRKSTYIPEDMKVDFASDLKIKSIGKDMKEIKDFRTYVPYEFTGIAKFEQHIELLEKELSKFPTNWFEGALDSLFRAHMFKAYVVDVTNYGFIEVDFPNDLDTARDLYLFYHYDDRTPDWEFGVRHGTERVQEDCMKLLLDMTSTLNKHGIKYWLNWGTLLGAYRDNMFIPWDTDIDVTVHAKDRDKVWSVIAHEMKQKGCFVPKREVCYAGDSWFTRDGEKIELNFVEDTGTEYNYEPNRCSLSCDKHYIDKLELVNFQGYLFTIPSDTDNYLKLSYGDNWKTPLKNVKPVSVATGKRP